MVVVVVVVVLVEAGGVGARAPRHLFCWNCRHLQEARVRRRVGPGCPPSLPPSRTGLWLCGGYACGLIAARPAQGVTTGGESTSA